MSELSLSQILKSRLRLTLALMYLPRTLRRTNTTLISWLDTLSVGPAAVEEGHDTELPHLDFEATISADFKRLTWRAAGLTPFMARSMSQFFTQAGADESAIDALEELVYQLQPKTIGTWVEAYASNTGDNNKSEVDAGWYLPQPLALSAALKIARTLTPESQTPARIEEWASAMKATQCLRLSRSIAAGNPFTEIRIDMPGNSVDEWVLGGVRLFDALKLVDLPDDALGALLNANAKQMIASICFTQRGVIKTGLMVAQPELDLTLAFFRMATTAQHAAEYSALAELEGNLNVEGPTWAEAQQRASGFGAEFHYTIPE